jgi:AcrR family transcriptional regulator
VEARYGFCTKRFRTDCSTGREDAVTDVDTTAAAPTRRAAQRREAICDAVFELLGEVGYDRMTMDAVAARAHASKATIYRSWPDKPELVVEALVNRFSTTPEPDDTGSLRGDLMALATNACEIANSPDGDVITGILTAATMNQTLATAMHECMYESKRKTHATIVGRAVARGELESAQSAALLHEVVHAMLLTRKFWSDEQVDEKFALHLVDDILIPLLTRCTCQ